MEDNAFQVEAVHAGLPKPYSLSQNRTRFLAHEDLSILMRALERG